MGLELNFASHRSQVDSHQPADREPSVSHSLIILQNRGFTRMGAMAAGAGTVSLQSKLQINL